MRQGIELNLKHIKDLAGPLVYIYFDERRPIYIGSSRFGISRPFSPQHHIPNLTTNCTKLQLIPCETHEEALKLERALIRKFLPKFNIEGKRALEIAKLCNWDFEEWVKYLDHMKNLDIVPHMDV
jgi:excinuclease UvrABC nuclease subunit